MKLTVQMKAAFALVMTFTLMVIVSCSRPLSLPVTASASTPIATATPLVNTPTPTNTVCNVGGNTCTFTATSTTTDTYTATATPTITNTPLNTNTPTITMTATNTPVVPTATPNPNFLWDDFDEAPWTTVYPSNTYLASAYVQMAVVNSIASNTSVTHNGSTGSMDVNVTFSASSGNLLEMTFEYGPGTWGGATNTQIGGVNPTKMSFWVYPTNAMSVAKVWLYQGSPMGPSSTFDSTTTLAANTWTNVVADVSGIVANYQQISGAMMDLTSPTATTQDVYFDDIYFYP